MGLLAGEQVSYLQADVDEGQDQPEGTGEGCALEMSIALQGLGEQQGEYGRDGVGQQ